MTTIYCIVMHVNYILQLVGIAGIFDEARLPDGGLAQESGMGDDDDPNGIITQLLSCRLLVCKNARLRHASSRSTFWSRASPYSSSFSMASSSSNSPVSLKPSL